MVKTAREAALVVLERCRRDKAFSDTLLNSVIRSSELSAKDSALAVNLCYGVLQNMYLCDFYIDYYTSPNVKLEPKLRDILRLSVYQILFLDRIPPHAAVSEGVELCKKCGLGRASGLANAVLRRLVVNKDKLPEIPKESIEKYLSVKYSTPPSLVELFIAEFGVKFAQDFLQANNAVVPMTIQVNTLKTSEDELYHMLQSRAITVKRHAFLPGALDISGAGNIAEFPEHKAGLFYVQDAASRLAVVAAGLKVGDLLLDACAAPGGKSFAAAIAMKNKGRILSCDINEGKLKRIVEGALSLSLDCVSTSQMDAKNPNNCLFGAFDVVLADVPCSGFGIIRKKPDIRYKDLSEIKKLPETQLAILNGLSSCVKDGGVLLYSSCTVLKRENSEVIDAFLSRNGEFSREAFTLPSPLGSIESGELTLFPHIHDTDGFYICKLRKAGRRGK